MRKLILCNPVSNCVLSDWHTIPVSNEIAPMAQVVNSIWKEGAIFHFISWMPCIYYNTEHSENVFYWRNIIYLGLWRTTQQKQKDVETSGLDVIPGWVSWEHSKGRESPPLMSWTHFFLCSPGYWAANIFCWLILYFFIHQYHR